MQRFPLLFAATALTLWTEPALATGPATIAAAMRHERAARATASTAKELPDATVVESKIPTAGDTIGGHFVSHEFKSADPKTHSGTDLLELEARDMTDFIEGRGKFKDLAGVPAKNKGIVLVRYEVGFEKDIAALLAGKTSGLRNTILITDFNTGMDGKFAEGDKFTADFGKAEIKDNPMGKGLKRLLDAGFKIGDLAAPYVVFSQPLYRKDDGDIDPIMHEKELLLIVYDDAGAVAKVFVKQGTANMTDNPRYNRILEINDPDIARYLLEHARALASAFANGETIKKVQFKGPLRVTYADGSFQEAAFTDGRFNPNDRITELLERAADPRSGLKIKRVVFSEFVLTNGNVVEALRKAMKAVPDLEVSGVFDDKFVGVDGFGMAAVLAGFNVYRPFGKPVYGFSSDLRGRLKKLYVYQRGVPGRVETDTEGPPLARHIWHDKTTVLEVIEDGKPWTYVFTGSLNASTHVDNAELQLMFRFPAAAPEAAAFRDSILDVAAAETEYAIPLELGVFRGFIARLTGRSVLEVPVETAEKIRRAFEDGQHDAAVSELVALGEKPTGLAEKVPPKAVHERVLKLVEFVKWYTQNPVFTKKGQGLSARKIVAAGFPLAYPKAHVLKDKLSLKAALWQPDLSDDQLEEQTKKAWEVIGQTEPFPERKDDAPDDKDDKDGKDGGKIDVLEGRPRRGGGPGASGRGLKIQADTDFERQQRHCEGALRFPHFSRPWGEEL